MWYRASYQLGLTVDGYGDGLVILNARPRTAKSDHGGGSIIVTTYGLDDGAFGRLADRWNLSANGSPCHLPVHAVS